MELEYSIGIKRNCQRAKMKTYKKWTKASRKWEKILPNTARRTMYTCEGRDMRGKENKSSEILCGVNILFLMYTCPCLSVNYTIYISICMCVCTDVYIQVCVYICTHTLGFILSFFWDITKNPFEERYLPRKFHFCPCSWLSLGIILSAIILT